MYYAMPRADGLPLFQTEISEVPSTTDPLGMRGGSEGGITPGPEPRIARHTRSGVAGNSMCSTSNATSAPTIAFATAARSRYHRDAVPANRSAFSDAEAPLASRLNALNRTG
jgi:hypothetical protein